MTRVAQSLPEGSAKLSWVPAGLAAFHHVETLPEVCQITYPRLLVADATPQPVDQVLVVDVLVLVLARPFSSIRAAGRLVVGRCRSLTQKSTHGTCAASRVASFIPRS